MHGGMTLACRPRHLRLNRSLATMCDGDARAALNALELAAQFCVGAYCGKHCNQRWLTLRHVCCSDARGDDSSKPVDITGEAVKKALQKTHLLYDRKGEEHYNIISALHKSLRGSDVDAALYWMGRMLVAGEDPRYVARRLMRFASEDIGLADPMVRTPRACRAHASALH